MALFNYATKEVTLKIVYYGPGLSGKTTNLQYLHSSIDPSKRGKLLSLATEADRTLFFDFMPVELGKVKDFSIRFQLYTVPGQVRYNATRKLVLKGADAVVFVADSQKQMLNENIESLENMYENLRDNNIDPEDIPIVMQYNKRDLPDIMSVEELNQTLNKKGYPYFEAVAIEGKGVNETFQATVKLLLKQLAEKYRIGVQSQPEPAQKESPETEPFPPAEESLTEPSSFSTKEEEEEIKEPLFETTSFSSEKGSPGPEPFTEEPLLHDSKHLETSEDLGEKPEEEALITEDREPLHKTFERQEPTFLDQVSETSLEDIRTSLDEIKQALSRSKPQRESSVHLRLSIEKLLRTMETIQENQTQMIKILKDIQSAINRAKTKKRWLFFR